LEAATVDPITFQQLLDALADDGADLAEVLSGEAGQATDVAELEAEALRVFDEIRTRDVVSEEDVAAQEQLADVVEALRAEQGRRDAAAAAEQQARIAELAGRVNPAADDAGDETGQAAASRKTTRTTRPAAARKATALPVWARAAARPRRRAPNWCPGPVHSSVSARPVRRRVDLGRVTA
jgi:hypothetical protein